MQHSGKNSMPGTWRLSVAGLCVFLGACSVLKHAPVEMRPPSIPGAEYVGPETCSTSDCHRTRQRYFQLNTHSTVAVRITDEDAEAGVAEACETCHGPGSIHVENRGRKSGDILTPDAETCFGCHLDIKGKFMLQHHHPVPEGVMSCSDCHDMHGSDVRAREGCGSCHDPHGSINDKRLVAGQTITCLRCHWESRFNTATGDIGDHAHSSHNIAAGQDCVDCHTAVHGSNIWRSLRK